MKHKPTAKNATVPNPEGLFARVASILDQARGNVVRAVNSNMVLAYWLIGREIVQGLQGGEERAGYGKKVIETLSSQLTERYGKGFSVTNLWYFKQFHLAFEDRLQILHPAGGELGELTILHPLGGEFKIGQKLHPPGAESSMASPLGRKLAPPETEQWQDDMFCSGFSPQLTWSHYRALMRVDQREARDFYECEAIAGGWDKRTLERQIQTAYFERHLSFYHCRLKF